MFAKNPKKYITLNTKRPTLPVLSDRSTIGFLSVSSPLEIPKNRHYFLSTATQLSLVFRF